MLFHRNNAVGSTSTFSRQHRLLLLVWVLAMLISISFLPPDVWNNVRWIFIALLGVEVIILVLRKLSRPTR